MTSSQRQAIVTEAKSWLRTPYHDHGRLKGAGADCAMFPLEVYTRVLDFTPPPLPKWVQQHNLHRGEEQYLDYVRACGAIEIPETELQPGDFALWRIGRCYFHGAIVVSWPLIIHAVNPRGVIYDDATRDEHLSRTAITRPLYFTF